MTKSILIPDEIIANKLSCTILKSDYDLLTIPLADKIAELEGKLKRKDSVISNYMKLLDENKAQAIRDMLDEYKARFGVNSADNSVAWFEKFADKLEE